LDLYNHECKINIEVFFKEVYSFQLFECLSCNTVLILDVIQHS